MALTRAETIAAVYCGSKRAYPTLDEAEAWAARHHSCGICVDGTVRLGAYPCAASPYPAHFHVGHMSVGRDR